MKNFFSQKSGRIIGVVFIIFLIIFFGLIFFKKFSHKNVGNYPTASFQKPGRSPSDNRLSNLPSCGNKEVFFTTSPLKPDDFTFITPLGNPNPPHVFPTDHIYFYLRRSSPEPVKRGGLPPAAEVPLYAPSDIEIFSINNKDYFDPPHTDYLLEFAPCKEFSARFDHLASLSPAILQQFQPSNTQCQMSSPGGTKIKNCQNNVSIKLHAGDVIGTVGGPNGSNNLDFRAVDQRSPALTFANASRWSQDDFHIVCPVDYFEKSLKNLFNKRFGGFSGFRTVKPVCGKVAYDVASTAQGVWFAPGTTTTHPEDPHLALVPDNVDPTRQVISAGSSLGKSGLRAQPYYFTPTTSGVVNRDFKDVKANNTVYCYETLGRSQEGSNSKVVIILQEMSVTTLRMEKLISAECGQGPWQFSSKASDFER